MTNSTSTADSPSLEELHVILQELDALERLQKSMRILFYRPIGHQPQFHAASRFPVRVVLGSNRSGKTTAGAAEAIAHMKGYRPWLPENHPDRIVRLPTGDPIPVPNIGRIVAQNFQQAIVQTIHPKMLEWMPEGTYTVKKDQRGIPIRIEDANGSIVYYMSNEQDDLAFEGPNGHWAWVDEPCDYKKYVGLKRGLVDFNGDIWLTLTPLRGSEWLNDVLITRANEPNSGVKLFRFSVWDNCTDNGGYLTRGAIEEFLSDLREDEIEARLHANFIHLAGRVYKEWEPEPPYWVPTFRIPDVWPRVAMIDPHPRKPVAVLWIAFNPDNQRIVYREMYDPKLKTISEIARAIHEAEGWIFKNGVWLRTADTEPVAYRIIDNSAVEPERTSGSNVHRKFMLEGLYCALAQKRNAQAGYDAIHDALRVQNEWSQPGLVVFDCCRETKRNFMNFCYDEWQTDRQREVKGEKQDYRKTNDDMIDNIRYTYQSGLSFQMLRRMLRESMQREEPVYAAHGMKIPLVGMHPGYRRHERQEIRNGRRD